ncbi:ankyrin repeat-containing domain protein [Fusarium oxysporum]|nr:ankyrin repeat-containing domain protein [Fusarium oxysporum]
MGYNPHATFGIIALGLHHVLDGWLDENLSSLVKSRGVGLLYTAATFGHTDLCERLIGLGCDPDRHTTLFNHYPIGPAVYHEKLDILRLLLKHVANPNRVFSSHSLLCEVVGFGSGVIHLLLQYGADPNIRCNTRQSESNCTCGCALSRAARAGKLDVLEVLIEHKVDVNPKNLRDAYGSPLVAAIIQGELNCARFLIKHGAKDDAQLECGKYGSALAAAAYSGHLEIVKLLVQQHNVDVNTTLKFGDFGSALAAAVVMGRDDCVNFLVEYGAYVNA